MKTRLITSLAVAALATMSLSSCALISPQATLDPYAPSDGVEVNVADLEVRNLMFITDPDAQEFNLVFGVVNSGPDSAKLGFRVVDADGKEIGSADVKVEAGFSTFGDLSAEPVTMKLRGVEPGTVVTVYVQTPGGEQRTSIPVLDGTLKDADGTYAFPEYRELVP